jgi:hypothetical protein
MCGQLTSYRDPSYNYNSPFCRLNLSVIPPLLQVVSEPPGFLQDRRVSPQLYEHEDAAEQLRHSKLWNLLQQTQITIIIILPEHKLLSLKFRFSDDVVQRPDVMGAV